MIHKLCLVAVLAVGAAVVGCSSTPKLATSTDREVLRLEVRAAIDEFKRVDPSMGELFESAKAYAVFPSVGKGAVGVGGAYGRGEFFENGTRVGYCDLSQATVGLQLGGQSYSEVIFFEGELALQNFKTGTFAFSAQASAVAAASGSSADADYENGVLVFTMARGGLMFEASIGGQRFRYEPVGDPN